jgi:hypothetical protein
MPPNFLETEGRTLTKGLASNTTQATFTTGLDTDTTAPTDGDNTTFGIIDVGTANHCHIVPFGTDGDGETGGWQIYGIEVIKTPGLRQYLRTLLYQFTGTLDSALVGDSGYGVTDSDMFCNKIVAISPSPSGLVEVWDPANLGQFVARVVVDCMGFDKLDVRPAINSGTMASLNYLWRLMK